MRKLRLPQAVYLIESVVCDQSGLEQGASERTSLCSPSCQVVEVLLLPGEAEMVQPFLVFAAPVLLKRGLGALCTEIGRVTVSYPNVNDVLMITWFILFC